MKEAKETPNEKLILVKGPKEEELTTVLVKFCEMYNQNNSSLALKFYKKEAETFLITFPDDVDFELFCYLVNYLKYPMDMKYDADPIGWTTAEQVDAWRTNAIKGKRVLVFIDPQDDEYDNVMVTTENNETFEIGFAEGEGLEKRNNRILDYRNQDINVAELRNLEGVIVK